MEPGTTCACERGVQEPQAVILYTPCSWKIGVLATVLHDWCTASFANSSSFSLNNTTAASRLEKICGRWWQPHPMRCRMVAVGVRGWWYWSASLA